MKDSTDPTLYFPHWFQEAVFFHGEKQPRKASSSCAFWGSSGLKQLGILLGSLQKQILSSPYSSSKLTLNLEELPKILATTLRETRKENFYTFISQLGSLRLYCKREETRESFPLFSAESLEGNTLKLTLSSYADELILGIGSTFHRTLAQASKQKNPFSLPAVPPLPFKKSFWLELKKEELAPALLFEQKSFPTQNQASLGGASNLGNLPSNFFKGATPSKILYKLNLLAKKGSFHNLTDKILKKEILWINSSEEKTQLLLNRKTSEHSHSLEAYYKGISHYFTKKALTELSSFLKTFVSLDTQRNLARHIQSFQQEILSRIDDYSKDFLLIDKKHLCPLILVFLELIARLQSHDEELSWTKGKLSFLESPIELESFWISYQKFLALLKNNTSFQETLEENCFLFNGKSPQFLTSRAKETNPNLEPWELGEERKQSLPPNKEKKPFFHEASTNPYQASQYPPEELKNKIHSELVSMKTSSSRDYQKLKEIYYNSLDEKSLGIMKTLETKMRRELFESQIQRRLVNFIYNNPGEINEDSLPALKNREKSKKAWL